MAFLGQVTTSVLDKEVIIHNIITDPFGRLRETTTWKINTSVSTCVGYAIVNGLMCARHDHQFITSYETKSRLVAPVVHHGGHHYPPHIAAASPFPGLKATPHPMAIFGPPTTGHVIDQAVVDGLRSPHIAMFNTFAQM